MKPERQKLLDAITRLLSEDEIAPGVAPELDPSTGQKAKHPSDMDDKEFEAAIKSRAYLQQTANPSQARGEWKGLW